MNNILIRKYNLYSKLIILILKNIMKSQNQKQQYTTGQCCEKAESSCPRCCSNNQAILVCINEFCGQKPTDKSLYQHQTNSFLTCGNKKCKCYEYHKKCLKSDIDYLVQTIQAKKFNKNQFVQKINIFFDRFIDKIYEFKQNILENLKKSLDMIEKNKIQNKFVKFIKNQIDWRDNLSSQKEQQAQLNEMNHDKLHFSGKDRLKIWNYVQNQQNSTIKTSQKIFSFLQTSTKQSLQILKKIQQSIDNMLFLQQFKTIKTKVLENSSIIKEVDAVQTLKNFYSQRIVKTSLLYKPDQLQNTIQTFFSKHQQQQNLLILCLTQDNKILGGYSQISFYDTNFGSYKPDPSKKSFIFRLNEKDKFSLKNKDKALFIPGKKNEICFGYSEMCICYKGEELFCETKNVNYYYYNEKYKNWKQEMFKIKELEVWKVEFESKYQN